MAYATVLDVERLDGVLTFTATSRPTASDVVGFLEDRAGELDGLLAARDYTVPVPSTATAAFRLVQRWNAVGANALALRANPDNPGVEAAEKAWDKIADMLRKGDVELPGAGRDTAELSIRSSFAAADGSATAFFYRDSDY